MLSVVVLSVALNSLCRVLQSSLFCWMSLCWVSWFRRWCSRVHPYRH